MSNVRAMSASDVELSLGQAFCVQGHCDLDLWSDDLNINRGHLLVNPSLHDKFDGHGCRQCRVITRTSFLRSRSLWPWPLIRWPQNQYGSSTGQTQPPCQVWDDRSRHCWVITRTSFGLPTDRHTERPTCAKQYTPLLRRGHNKQTTSMLLKVSFRYIFHHVKNVFILCYVFPYHFVYINYFLLTVDIIKERLALRCCGRYQSKTLVSPLSIDSDQIIEIQVQTSCDKYWCRYQLCFLWSS